MAVVSQIRDEYKMRKQPINCFHVRNIARTLESARGRELVSKKQYDIKPQRSRIYQLDDVYDVKMRKRIILKLRNANRDE